MSTCRERTCSFRAGDPGTFLIRAAREDDAAELLEHGRRTVRTSPHAVTMEDELPADHAKEREWIRDHLENPGKLVLIAELPGPPPRLIGALSFRNHPRRRMAHHGHFGIGVEQPFQGRGVGRQLILTLLDWAREHPVIEKICLGVFASNARAVRLYQSLGFTEECRRQKEFKMAPGHYVDDIQMSLWVKPPEPTRDR